MTRPALQGARRGTGCKETPPPLPNHVRKRCTEAAYDAANIHVEHALPLGISHFSERCNARDSGIGKDDVYPPEALERRSHEPIAAIALGEVRLDHKSFTTPTAHRVHSLRDIVRIAAEPTTHDIRTRFREHRRRCSSYARRRARHKRYSALQRKRRSSLRIRHVAFRVQATREGRRSR